MSSSPVPSLLEQALAALKRKGNPFRQQFARNSDDAVCSLYHVDDLFAEERCILRQLVESYRGQPGRPTTVLPVLGARGAGKTHLLHWLKHEPVAAPQLFVTPGTFRIDASGPDSGFLEYLLYQFINVLLAGGEQRGVRPLVVVAEQLTRRTLGAALAQLPRAERLRLAKMGVVQRLLLQFGLDLGGYEAGIAAFCAELTAPSTPPEHASVESLPSCRALAEAAQLDPEQLVAATNAALEQSEPRDLKGELRKRIIAGCVRASLLDDSRPLADFLTDGFADVPSVVRPTRTYLTLTLLQALTEVIVGAGIPVAVAFDQLEELLYGQTEDEIRRSSDAFFGGIVQLMSQVPGLCLLLLVEEGLWNRIVPPLSSHILDRIHEPIHLPSHGTLRQVRLSTPTAQQLAKVVSCRVRRTLGSVAGVQDLPLEFPFDPAFLQQLAARETVLRLMLQGCCNRLDELFDTAGTNTVKASRPAAPAVVGAEEVLPTTQTGGIHPAGSPEDLAERWRQEVRMAERKLKPVASLSGATAELQGGLVRYLHVCKLLGVEQDDWRLSGITDQVSIGDHPTYGTLTIVEWTNAAGATQRVGIGLWLGRGVGKPRDLETKLQVFTSAPPAIDHLILFRPADDARLSGRTQAAWEAARAAGHSARVEPVELDLFAKLYAFPRWMQQVSDAYPDGTIPDAVYLFLRDETEAILQRLTLPPEAPALPQAA